MGEITLSWQRRIVGFQDEERLFIESSIFELIRESNSALDFPVQIRPYSCLIRCFGRVYVGLRGETPFFALTSRGRTP